jgi:hypothetical protein
VIVSAAFAGYRRRPPDCLVSAYTHSWADREQRRHRVASGSKRLELACAGSGL